jgi:tRNA G10  N-methylase Trm11
MNLGGILLACAEFGSYVVGSEFDWRVLTAQGNSFKSIDLFLLLHIQLNLPKRIRKIWLVIRMK